MKIPACFEVPPKKSKEKSYRNLTLLQKKAKGNKASSLEPSQALRGPWGSAGLARTLGRGLHAPSANPQRGINLPSVSKVNLKPLPRGWLHTRSDGRDRDTGSGVDKELYKHTDPGTIFKTKLRCQKSPSSLCRFLHLS